MDASTLLEQYMQDLSNLPSELAYLLEELREKDLKLYDIRKRISQRDNQLFKHIKQQGSLVKHPKEDQIYQKNREDFEKGSKIQEEKCVLANTALFLLAKHLTKLENDIEKLEQEGVVPPILNEESSDEEDAENGPASAQVKTLHAVERVHGQLFGLDAGTTKQNDIRGIERYRNGRHDDTSTAQEELLAGAWGVRHSDHSEGPEPQFQRGGRALLFLPAGLVREHDCVRQLRLQIRVVPLRLCRAQGASTGNLVLSRLSQGHGAGPQD
ncbi:hypothetical protein KL930_002942 [Ogataea haglerorum]|uniref:Inhibitor of growth protein N-terminal histone-binding domain-containing protein n=1 Tax=Ogataea haglerorum TaxID=1937702 RepID=A0AAN6I0S1_9ASCO|nr:uncharacterized protein KL911_002801 [Ogataea haglerorum]KAG7694094.1 hypothetical protein KL915_003765 [Ogataea haglerorum]KAG7694795.1 hypothetical protein KL951_003972 [Ogataea haglerorum]KAG7704643.1 hypothetical protein KL914_004034 [Ogataea haglerorum]KAG7704917.1 hypothetical protein KL950_004090 [Ogataea haglerorum]KAG7719098.1 hypothetical protein KL913_002096 [Ogataea haglerorum]